MTNDSRSNGNDSGDISGSSSSGSSSSGSSSSGNSSGSDSSGISSSGSSSSSGSDNGSLNNAALPPRRIVLSGLPQTLLPYLYSLAHALVIPSHGEGINRCSPRLSFMYTR